MECSIKPDNQFTDSQFTDNQFTDNQFTDNQFTDNQFNFAVLLSAIAAAYLI